MINNIPSIIYDKEGNIIRIIKTSTIFFRDRREIGYVFHIEQEERVTSISEFDLTYREGRFILTNDIFKNKSEI